MAAFAALIFLTSFSWAQAQDLDRALAEYYAPTVLHEIGRNLKADTPTRVDYDGDFYTDNSWDNLDKFDVPPAVYYEVIETKTHYFITYGFFHARDYSNYFFCLPELCHENDFEGSMLVVRKDGGFGKLEYIEALAHLSISGNDRPYVYIGNSTHKGGVVERPVLRIESGGHGIHVWNGEYPKRWPFQLMLPTDDSSVPRDGQTPLHYALLPIADLWALRDDPQVERVFSGRYDFKGDGFTIKNLPRFFAGHKYGTCSLPWSWGELGAKRGEWFLDPARWYKRKLKNPRDFSLEYLRHPYLSDPPSRP